MTQVHSGHCRNPQTPPEGPALVVGGGNSGLQIAEGLAATRQVDLSIGADYPMLPHGWSTPRGAPSGSPTTAPWRSG